MVLMKDWGACLFFIMSFCPLINNLNISSTDHEMMKAGGHNKYIENYQLLGELRDYCELDRDCREYAYVCNRNLCDCAEGYRTDERNKTCVGGVGAKCSYDSHCVDRAYCRKQLLCFCKKEYWVMSDDYWSCRGEWESKGNKLASGLFIVHLLIAAQTLLF